MDLLESMEVRWFLADADPATGQARRWFDSIAVEGRRVDQYFLTGRADLGFKARLVEKQVPRVETKYLLEPLGVIQIASNVFGKLERWNKLSVAAADGAVRDCKGAWLRVGKARRLRKFAFRAGSVAEVAAASRPEAGCGIELTELEVGEAQPVSREWTLGIEAFSASSSQLREVFEACCRHAFAAAPELALSAERSLSYPAWLKLCASSAIASDS